MALRYLLGSAFAISSTSIVSLIGLYHVFAGKGGRVSFGWFLETTSPFLWASLGVALAVSLSVVGAAMESSC